MDCSHARELLVARLDGELAAAQAGEIEAHLTACPECARELESLERASGALRAWAIATEDTRTAADLRDEVAELRSRVERLEARGAELSRPVPAPSSPGMLLPHLADAEVVGWLPN